MPTSVTQPQAPDKFAFLEELTSSQRHGKKTFYQHLFNVYSFLKSQSLRDEVCDAGLFHSIYGTEFYHFENANITRDVVCGYIGDYAEELVHIYCGLKEHRFNAIVQNASGWSAQQHMDLCRVEYANCWDVRENRDVIEQMKVLEESMAKLEKERAD